MIFIKILEEMLKVDLIHQTRNQTNHCLKEKNVIGLTKDELGGKIILKCVGLKVKTYSYLIEDGGEDKKAKVTIKYVIKRKLTFEYHKTCLEATQIDNKLSRKT